MNNNQIFCRVCCLALLIIASNAALAATAEDTVYSLAQRCVVVQSPATGKLLEHYKDQQGVTRYRFDTQSVAGASHFYLKPAALGTFLMTDADGRYLSSLFPSLEIALSSPDTGSEWLISATPEGSGFLFRLENAATRAPLRHAYVGRLLPKTETLFSLQERPASECKPFPEVQVNVTANGYAKPIDALKTSPTNIRGYIDGHTHLTVEEFAGGNIIAGKTFHRWGVPHALKDCKEIHGTKGKRDTVGIVVGGDEDHVTAGWPQFTTWPDRDSSVTHNGYYYKWVERAHLSGLRLMVVYTMENEVLCRAGALLGEGGKSCDTMNSVQRQVDNLNALQNYVDAQSGGPGKGFFRIVLDPAAARKVIADGKLAVVIGIEASETFNCSDRNSCDANKLKSRLDTYKAMGVRSIFPVHKFDTQVGGATLGTPSLNMINIGNFIDNGNYFGAEVCDANTEGKIIYNFDIKFDPAKIPGYDRLSTELKTKVNNAVSSMLKLINKNGPSYDQAVRDNACNSRGLTPLGAVLINAMIDRKILIDTDHGSTKMVSAVLDIAEQRGYSGLVASHGEGDSNKTDPSAPHYNYLRLARLGGHISVLTRNNLYFPGIATPGFKAMQQAANEKGYLAGIGIGTDFNGLIKSISGESVVYPFTTEFGTTFNKQVSGDRTFDLTKDGMVHYGLLPDLMASYAQWMRDTGHSDIYESMMNSAESYLQMWERATR